MLNLTFFDSLNDVLYRNDGAQEESGPVIFARIIMDPVVTISSESEGSSWCDYDNDGDLDLVVTNSSGLFGIGQDDFLFRNIGNSNSWINILLAGTASNLSAIGARVSLKATINGAAVWQTREISGQTGMNSQNSLNAEFGLGDASKIDSIRIRWPSGILQEMTDVAVNQFLTITESQFGRVTAGDIVNDGGFSFGSSWGDFDQDGDQDLFVANAGGNSNFLYENNGDGSFNKLTTGVVVTDGGSSQSSTWGDYNDDGVLDLFVTNTGNNFLYEGNGDGTFNKVTVGPVVTDGGNSKGCAWGDYDNDGDLDLFVANAGGENNFLYENNGDGSFGKVSMGVMVTDGGDSFGCSWSDYDNDGDLDLFVSNANDENDFFYENKLSEGLGFIRITDLIFVTSGGDSQGSSWGDYDNDGDLDVLVTRTAARAREGSGYILYRNEGRETPASGVHFTQTNILSAERTNSFGSSWGDFDNDGDLDLIVANSGDNFLFRNDGDDGFTRFLASDIDKTGGSSIASTWADFNQDGFLDLFVTNFDQDNFLYQTFTSRNHWLNIHLEGRFSNTSAIGTRVRVLATIDGEPRWQTREISGQTGYFGQNSLNAQFGLSDATVADSIRIEWPSGAVNRYADIAVDQFLVLQENNRPKFVNEIADITLSSAAPVFAKDLNTVFVDPEGDALIYSAASSDTAVAKAQISSSTLTITLASETALGQAKITVTADDGNVDDGRGNTEEITIEVNRRPFIVNVISNQSYLRNFSDTVADLTKIFVDPDGNELTYTISSSDSSVAIASVTGSVLTVSTGDSLGEARIRVTADDLGGGTVSLEFSVTAVPDNTAPRVTGDIPDLVLITFGQPFTRDLNSVFVDDENNVLTYSAFSSNIPSALAQVSGDTLIVTPRNLGIAIITVGANDGLGGGASDQFNVEVLRSFRPEIFHEPILSQNVGQPIAIEADITDDEGALASAFLNYRVAGDASFEPIPMDISTINDTTFHVTGAIPSVAVTDRGVEYFITAQDTHGVQSRLPTSGIYAIRVRVGGEGVTKASAQPGGDEQTGYRLISMPLDLDSKQPDAVLEDDLGAYDPTQWRLYQWVALPTGGVAKVEFPNTSEMSPGMAFWLIVKSSDKIIDTGAGTTVATSDRFPIALSAGWNLIGSPFNFATLAEDTLSDGSALSLRFYNGSWSAALNPATTELQPFAGYAVFSNSASTLFIKPNPSFSGPQLAKQMELADNQPLWSIRIRAQCQNARDDNNLAAVAPGSSQAWDMQDTPEPPGIGEYVSLYFPHPEWERTSHRFSTDVRPQVAEGQEWQFEVTTNIRDVVNLSFEGLETVPAEYDVRLVDKMLRQTTVLRQQNRYSVAIQSVDNPKRLTLVVGKRGYMDEALAEFNQVPTDFQLLQNYPNPFNPATTIQYGLPNSSRVTLKVYNILGEEVATLVNNEQMEAGYHAAVWDGRNTVGHVAASGVYLIRMQAGSFVQARKMLLVQ